MKTGCCCGCNNCLCEHPVIQRVLKNKKKARSNSTAAESSSGDTYSDPYYYKTETATTYDKVKTKPQYPFSVNVRPNIYYDVADATYSNEDDNIYYKITNFSDKIKDFIIGRLSYTKNRDYFEKVEKLRFRLPVADQLELKTEPAAEEVDAKVEAMYQFREKYSDECMWSRVREDKERHTCVHRYHLNDRRFPQPSLTDEDGNSLCSTCYTASNYMMENNVSPLNCEKRFVIPGDSETIVARGNKEDAPILVLEAPENKRGEAKFLGGSRYNSKHQPFPNSVALRFQPRKLC